MALSAFSGSALADDERCSFEFQGIERTYIVHIPPSYDRKTPLPLVIGMHGFAAGARIHAYMSQMNPKADKEDFIVVYPNGTGFPRAWNAGFTHRSKKRSAADDVGFINALIDTMIANYAVDAAMIYATGFSNGGMMSHRLACELSERIAAIAPVAGGLVFENCEPERSVPAIHFHARNDGIVKYYGDTLGEENLTAIDAVMAGWAERSGCDHGPDSLYTEDSTALRQRWWREDSDVEVILWTTEDGKHTWPGGKGVPFPGAARPSKAISANDLMWEFLSKHPRGMHTPSPGDPEDLSPSNTVYPDESPE